jgi:hypothetical protein
MNDVPARLIVKRGPNQEQTFSLPSDEVTIGRSSTNVVAIPDPEVSRRHACIRMERSNYVVEDWASTNGTFVNGKRISGPATLYNGDEIRLGETIVLQFTVDDARFQRADWGQQVVSTDAETIVEAEAINWSAAAEPASPVEDEVKELPQAAAAFPEPIGRRGRARRWVLGCGCLFIVLIFLCMATIFFLDAYQQGRLLYCGPLRPFFEILLGPFGFAPICP